MNRQRLYSDIQRVNIRWIIRRDTQEFLDNERAGTSDPWNEEALLACLRNRNVIGMVAEIGDKVVGHEIYELCRDYYEVLRLVVHPLYRGMSVGSRLINKLKSKLRCERKEIWANVPEENLPMQMFLKSQGFLCKEIIKGKSDVYLMKFFLEGGVDRDPQVW